MKLFILLLAMALKANGMSIPCQFQDMEYEYLGNRISGYGCSYHDAEAENTDSIEFTGFTGDHQAGRSNEDVKILKLVNVKKLTDIKNISRYFMNLEVMHIQRTDVSEVTKYDLFYFENLKVLDLSENKIWLLNGDVFAFCRTIQFLNFEGNSILHVGEDLLFYLIYLEEARFESNPCIDVNAKTKEEYKLLTAKFRSECVCPQRCDVDSQVENLLYMVTTNQANIKERAQEQLYLINDFKKTNQKLQKLAQDLTKMKGYKEEHDKRLEKLEAFNDKLERRMERLEALVIGHDTVFGNSVEPAADPMVKEDLLKDDHKDGLKCVRR